MGDRGELKPLRQDLRTDWHRYVDELVPLRPDLYGYCRHLTGSVWDAENLVQETLQVPPHRQLARIAEEVPSPPTR